MSIFLRKSIKLGKFGRINLSKKGLGYSFGIKGARIGKSSTGKNYISGGKGGIYFRETLKNDRTDSNKSNEEYISETPKLKVKSNSKLLKILKILGSIFIALFLFGLALELLPWVFLFGILIAIIGFIWKKKSNKVEKVEDL